MRKVFCIVAFMFCITKSNSQCSLVAERTNGLCYLGLGNPLRVCIANTSVKEIELKTDNGKISKVDNEGLFMYNPDVLGKATITVYKRGKEGERFLFRVEKIHNPIMKLDQYKSGDSVSLGFLLNSVNHIRTKYDENIDTHDIKLLIKSFSLLLFRGDSIIAYTKNETGIFSNNTKELFSKAKIGDRLMFIKVLCEGLDRNNIELNDTHLYIK